MPALLKQMSSVPNRSSAAAYMAATLVGIGHVGVDVEAADLVGDRAARLVGEIGDHDVGPFAREPDGAGPADAARRASDDSHLALESSRHGHSPIVGVEQACSAPAPAPALQLVAMKTFLSSVNASRASGPSSRPRPERLKPPKGVQ